MGEITRRETFTPDGSSAPAHRRLVRTGNFRITQSHFQWVDDADVTEREEPEWAIIAERLEWGRYYGFPQAFVHMQMSLKDTPAEQVAARAAELLAAFKPEYGGRGRLLVEQFVDGRTQSALIEPSQFAPPMTAVGFVEACEEPAAAWAAFERNHEAVRARWRTRRAMEKDDIGQVNHAQEEARLAKHEAELELHDVRAASGPGGDAYRQAAARLEKAGENYEKTRAWAEARFAQISRKIKAINDENDRFMLLMKTAGEGDKPAVSTLEPLADIVRAYPANQLSWMGKFQVNAARWWEFLTDEPREANSEGGVFPAIFGTVVMTLIMTLVVLPLGVLAALYLREYAKAGWVVSTVRIAVNNLAGVPSIVFGVFGLGFFCYSVGGTIDQWFFRAALPNPTFGAGGILWASLTLALMTLPVVIVATEEALAAVPGSMRQGSYACGASKWQTIRRIVLPRAVPGVMTGAILAMARGAGEVAPLMLVGAVKLAPELPIDGTFPFIHAQRSFMHLGFHIYDVGFQSQNSEAAKPMVFTTTLLLIAIIAALNLAAVWLRARLRRKFVVSRF
ncbi:MAG: phosphate ABC transporter permease PstA [Planctomycetes bacterium]|nr:phosphate ABC transporter permease PstA [Planctomycetota bacterium]